MIRVKLASSKLGVIYYTLDGSIPTSESLIYKDPIAIVEDSVLTFYSDDGFGHLSDIKTAAFTFTDTSIILVTDDGSYLITEDGELITVDI